MHLWVPHERLVKHEKAKKRGEDDVVLFFWENSKAVIERYATIGNTQRFLSSRMCSTSTSPAGVAELPKMFLEGYIPADMSFLP